MKLSVAMCTYNGARFIEEQLQSILDQELPVNEIVVCDDGSKDETLTIVQKIAKDYPNVEWNIQQNSPNLGVTKNFEKAISLCTGDIVFLSDQDDIWRKDKTRVVNKYFETHPDKSVVFTNADIVDSFGSLLTEYSLFDAYGLSQNSELWENGLDFEILSVANRATGATMAFLNKFRSSFLPFFQKKGYLHDYQIVLTASACECIGVIQERLISYRQHGNNCVGLTMDNWVYSGIMPSNYNDYLAEPLFPNHPLNVNTERMCFSMKRGKICSTFVGKLLSPIFLIRYKKYYHKYWLILFWADFLYGVNSSARKKIAKKIKFFVNSSR